MSGYRNKLAHYVKTKLAVIEYDDLEEAYALACGNTERGRDRLAKLTIRFSGKTAQYWERTLLLQSLFADQLGYREKSWPPDKIEPLKNYLALLRKFSPIDPPDVWAERVAKALGGKETFFLNNIKPKDRKTCTGALAIFCWWLNQKSSHIKVKDLTVNQLLIALGYSENMVPLLNCLDAVTGYRSIEKFLADLEKAEEPIRQPLLNDVGQYWWENKCKGTLSIAPKCIQ